jgi:tRNA nucleotidyltransferase/poly(A) polymerase
MNAEIISEQIIERICRCGWKAYLTGGAVRDLFRGANPYDFDIVTDALPEELQKIFPDRKVITVGQSFLVTIIDNVEVATYRSDKNTASGRNNCLATPCETIDEDLSRRDFTINALAVCPYTGEVIDPFKGRKDLDEKIIRFVGDPEQRIYEDYIRMIRAARFTCLIEGRLEEKSAEAIYVCSNLIKEVAPERIRLDILKVMTYRKPSIFFKVLHQTGLMDFILPEVREMVGHTGGEFHGETLEEHAYLTGDFLSLKDPVLRFIGYLHDIGKVNAYAFHKSESFVDHENIGAELIEKIFNRFRFTKEETQRAIGLVSMHMRSIDSLTTDKAIRRFLNRLSELKVDWKDWIRLKIADKKGNLNQSRPVTKDYIKSICLKIHKAKKSMNGKSSFKVIDLAINGNDIMKELNLKPGPKVGEILKNLLNLVLDNPELNTKEKLIEIAKNK